MYHGFCSFCHGTERSQKSRNMSRWYFAVVIVLMLVGVEQKKMIMEGACDEESNSKEAKKIRSLGRRYFAVAIVLLTHPPKKH